jgi:hypothetical protein
MFYKESGHFEFLRPSFELFVTFALEGFNPPSQYDYPSIVTNCLHN